MIRVEIDSIRVSLMTQDRVVILKDPETDRYLAIWIGPFEADALRVQLAGMEVTRPLTHDLLKSVITEMGGKIESVIVTDLNNDTYFARINIMANGRKLEVDARPSDAINLAVRARVPIYVEESVMERAMIRPEDEIEGEPEAVDKPAAEASEPDDEKDLDVFKDFLNSLDLDDLGDE